MTGKAGAPYKGKQYLNYRCSRGTKSRALCSFYNSHSAPKLERAVLEYLGQFSDPELVQEHLAAAETQEIKSRESELEDVERALKDLEAQFTKHLDYLKRDILNEKEFVKANEACRSQVEGLQIRQNELDRWVEKQSGITSAAERLPGEIKTFLEDFQGMDVRRQKSHLQTLLKAAYVYGHDTIELEFRK